MIQINKDEFLKNRAKSAKILLQSDYVLNYMNVTKISQKFIMHLLEALSGKSGSFWFKTYMIFWRTVQKSSNFPAKYAIGLGQEIKPKITSKNTSKNKK